jgi:Raf kinase inhibitor-like YbhB/YbcL family protein
MIITSPSFIDGGKIPKKFTCDGGEINPELQILNVPDEAISLALIMHDPDAPREGGFTHWVVWNIDPQTTLIKEESIPPGAVEGANGSGRVGYAPPCPPPGHGVHHYHFKLYALDVAIDLPEGDSAAELMEAIKGHLLEQAEFIGLYERA